MNALFVNIPKHIFKSKQKTIKPKGSPMRRIHVDQITDAIARLAQETNYFLGEDVCQRIADQKEVESSDLAKDILSMIEQNIKIAGEEGIPLCQDTGVACVFLEIGQEVLLEGRWLTDDVNEGVRIGYEQGYLRKSIVGDPLRRINTKDNTPAFLHVDIVPGDQLKIIYAPKGFGSENMSRVGMLTPSSGRQGVEDFVIETIRLAGGNPCPPIVVGVGIGGTFDQVTLLAKKALLLPLDHPNEDDYYVEMEAQLLNRINGLGIGPQGFGGDTTVLAVKILTLPTHIAGLPVAVNINCHVARHKEIIL
jgi:fumarate hydratase subunit alpha